MKSKKQLKRYKNKSKKFRSKKTKGGGGNQSTMSSSKTTDTTNIETNPLLYRAMEVLGKQEGLPSIGSFYLTNKNIMDQKDFDRIKNEYHSTVDTMNDKTIKRLCRRKWNKMNTYELNQIFDIFLDELNSRLVNIGDITNNRDLYWIFTKTWNYGSIYFDEIYDELLNSNKMSEKTIAIYKKLDMPVPEEKWKDTMEYRSAFYKSMYIALYSDKEPIFGGNLISKMH